MKRPQDGAEEWTMNKIAIDELTPTDEVTAQEAVAVKGGGQRKAFEILSFELGAE